MAINNYKIDYRAQTASHYTIFPQTMQSQKILAGNNRTLSDIASTTQSKIVSTARSKAQDSILGSTVNIFA